MPSLTHISCGREGLFTKAATPAVNAPAKITLPIFFRNSLRLLV
ncbi:MAG: hypothetical protein ACYC1M_11795 [Armatimonadota bacterium]